MANTPVVTSRETEAAPISPQELAELARSYAEASRAYLKTHKSSRSISQAPYRFAAIHAIELYLTAYLQLNRHEPKEIRDLQHDLEQRTARAIKAGLILRKRTVTHLGKLTITREYVETRYHPAAMPKLSQPAQLLATLNDVQQKVEKAVSR